jgi:ATP-dependent helicase/nuclease subunit A
MGLEGGKRVNAPTLIQRTPQRRASDPKVSVWVSANAGSGKTHVLVDRVIRLMLRGTEPSRILCLTFTKAAAAEMNRRLFDRLGKWVALSDGELDRQLSEIETEPFTAELRQRARKLFTLALETPGGLKIQTIHAFSERLLQLFPVEAGIIPGFEIMDDRTAGEMLKSARHSVISEAQLEPESGLGQALLTIVGLAQADKFDKLVSDVLKRRSELAPILANPRALAAAMGALRNLFGLAPGDTRESVIAELVNVDHALYRELIGILETRAPGGRDCKSATALAAILENSDAAERLLRELFLTDKFECRAQSTLMTAGLRNAYPEAARKLDAEQSRVFAQCGKIAALEMIAATECLMMLAGCIVGKYEEAKRLRGVYDFDDLIQRTQALLRDTPSASWVLYKLDGGIDHILVDEAQDTSPAQWEIITALAEDFFSGLGARPDIARTIFVVGDRKQSIFSFQGADPDAFDRARGHFATRIIDPELRSVDLTVSHRSTGDVLSAVDAVFADPSVRQGLNANALDDFSHTPVRKGHAGLVELWPVAGKSDKQEHEPWILPVDSIRRDHPSLRLARQIAATIRSWLDSRRIIESRGRAVVPGDILVLVRTRNRFFDAVLRELHHLAIPVAGADRVKLGEHIAIQDLLALGRFALLQEDDYSLACVLKSPLIVQSGGQNFGDEDLYAIAHARGTKSLWHRLCETPSLEPIRAILERWSALARTAAPFEFFSAILNEGKPSIRQRILTRLGSEADDLIDAFLDLALDFERDHAPGLHGFLTWFAAAETEIRRDMEQGSGEVRVMTVHGAKGLEANIVILPDTCSVPDGRTEPNLLIASDREGNALPLWRLPRRVEPEALARWRAAERQRAMEEYRRQLYVAMTRARDELYVAGYCMQDAPNGGCWHEVAKRGLLRQPGHACAEDGIVRLRGKQTSLPEDKSETGRDSTAPADAPAWAGKAMAEAPAPQWRAPSRFTRPGMDRAAALRGRAIHRLFQILPDVPAASQETIARRLLARHGFSGEQSDEISAAVLALIADARFAPFFAPSSLAEVPFAARLTKPLGPISGRIDRLVVGEREAFILDFKTDRQPPLTVSAVAQDYLLQLAGYRSALTEIFPQKSVRTALLWTAVPLLMEVPPDVLDQAFSAYHNPVRRT